MSDIDYSKLIVKPGKGYSQNSIVVKSYYNTPIQHNQGELSGNSRRWGDASVDVQKQVIGVLINTSRQFGLNDSETAIVLAIARHESGFNLTATPRSGEVRDGNHAALTSAVFVSQSIF